MTGKIYRIYYKVSRFSESKVPYLSIEMNHYCPRTQSGKPQPAAGPAMLMSLLYRGFLVVSTLRNLCHASTKQVDDGSIPALGVLRRQADTAITSTSSREEFVQCSEASTTVTALSFATYFSGLPDNGIFRIDPTLEPQAVV